MEPWSFEDGPEVAARMERVYGNALLSCLPLPLDEEALTPKLVNGYSLFLALTLQAVREGHQVRLSGTVPAWKKEELFRRAQAMQAALELLRRYLVAIELRQVTLESHGIPHVAAVLQAERRLEVLVESIELSPPNAEP